MSKTFKYESWFEAQLSPTYSNQLSMLFVCSSCLAINPDTCSGRKPVFGLCSFPSSWYIHSGTMLVPGLLVIDVTGLTGPRVLPDVVGRVVTGLEPAWANFDDPEKSSPSTSFALRRPLPDSSAIVTTMCSKDTWSYFYVFGIEFCGGEWVGLYRGVTAFYSHGANDTEHL